MHPIIRYFDYAHLPSQLQQVSKPFYDLAWHLSSVLPQGHPELDMALRKLLEAKDCAVRAAL